VDKGEVEEGRNDHATEGCRNRQDRLPRLSQLARHNLPLHLEADHEEKKRHEPVVDPVLERVRDAELADRESDHGFPKSQEPFLGWRIGEKQGRDREEKEAPSTRRFDVPMAGSAGSAPH
jgi:hypothetical protein